MNCHPLDELKKMNEKDLLEEIQKAKIELLKVRLSVASRQNKDVSKLGELRKYIARIKTIKRIMAVEQIKENPKSPLL